jgi:tRNA 2-thiocytidine biosynthesis protein TtcA
LYSTTLELGRNKIALGHHYADDAMENLLLNMLHAGQTKAIPARYTSQRGSLAVMRPLMQCMESDIAKYATLQGFPILPCSLCSNQANRQRPQVKLFLQTLQDLNPNAKQNMLNAMGDVRQSHLLDQSLRHACGMDPITAEDDDGEDAAVGPVLLQ